MSLHKQIQNHLVKLCPDIEPKNLNVYLLAQEALYTTESSFDKIELMVSYIEDAEYSLPFYKHAKQLYNILMELAEKLPNIEGVLSVKTAYRVVSHTLIADLKVELYYL